MAKKMEFINDGKKFSFCREDILGKGRYGVVFRGSFDNQEVAVKRILLTDVNNELGERELTNLRQLQHENIVNFFYVEDNIDFRFIVFELCDANLRDYCSPEYTGPVLSKESDHLKILLQLSEALNHIHSLDVIHRDIKPGNILVSNKDSSVNMKWADFGHSKLTNRSGSASLSGARGTSCWVPKEIIPFLRLRNGRGRCDKSGDIFAAGCVFFFFLTRGVHPFGDEDKEDILHKNIDDENIINQSRLDDSHFGKIVVIQMIKERIELYKVIEGLLNPQMKKEIKPEVHQYARRATNKSSVFLGQTRFQENIIPISDLSQGKRKREGWVIKARVIDGPKIHYTKSLPVMKRLFVTLQDDDRGEIRARACYSKNVNKFYPNMLQKGKEYLIRNAEVDRINNGEIILTLNEKTELTMI